MTTRSRKLFTYEYTMNRRSKQMEAKTRVLVPLDAPKYDSSIHFQEFEESDYLAAALKGVPYATFHTDDREEMENLVQNGFTDSTGEVWTEFFSYWKDQEGRAFLAPKSANINDLRDVGVHTHMTTPADFMKVGKYANRLFSALLRPEYGGTEPVWGVETDWSELDQEAIVQLEPHNNLTEEECRISVKYVDLKTQSRDQKALVDGCIAVNEKAVKALGLHSSPTIGMAWRGTFGTQRGLGKGHMPYVPHLESDVVIYGAKTILRTEKFFFGSMGELHVGKPKTDRQAFINFHFHRNGLALNLAKDFMKEIVNATRNEAGLRNLLLTHTKDIPNYSLDREGWILRRCLSYGISFQRFPGLFRRTVRYLAGPNSPVFQCDTQARIPMTNVAEYGYVLPDINVIDSEGEVHPELGIPEGTIVFPDLEPGTKVVCYRQPSENSNAWVELTVISKPEFKRFAGRGICLIGRGAADVLGRLGGGDMDDQFVIVHDPKWVENFRTMPVYPETEKISEEISEDDQSIFDQEQSVLNEFTDELLYDIKDRNLDHYTKKHVSWQIEMAKNARAGIGPVVNYGMMDMLMSDPDQRRSMLDDMDPMSEEHEWLEKREPWQAALFMTNLELVIDGNVKDSTLLSKLGDVSGTIRRFHKDCRVYPVSMAGRIPTTKLEQEDYVLAKSLTCKSLASINALRERLYDILVEREWASAAPADPSLKQIYPFERELAIRIGGEWKRDVELGQWVRVDSDVRSIKDIWVQGWMEANQKSVPVEVAYPVIIKRLMKEFENDDVDTMERLAVHLYYDTYKTMEVTPRIDETTGKARGYKDGLLWSPVFADHFINAMRKARLVGYYKPIHVRPEFRKRLMNNSVIVQVRSHSVYIQGADDAFSQFVGLVWGKAPDGTYRMDSGLIEFRKPQDLLLPADTMLVAQTPVVRVIPSKVKAKDEIKTPAEPEGLLGRMLKKALDVLK